MSTLHLLLVDDDPEFLQDFVCLAGAVFTVTTAQSGSEALDALKTLSPDAVLLDVDLGSGDDGISLLTTLRGGDPDLPVIMVSGDENPETVVRAMKAGATDYVSKHPNLDMLRLKVERALDQGAWRVHARALQSGALDEMVGSSAVMKQLREEIRAVGPSNVRVLIRGESGTGKELVAGALHEMSARRTERFVPVNGAVGSDDLFDSDFFGHEKGAFTGASNRRRGRFELASGGTLFIDEVGRMPTSRQAKLLRAIETGSIEPVGGGRSIQSDVRLITASNEDLSQKISDGTFLPDLFYRLSEYVIHVPPLRKRLSDLPELARVLLERFARREQRPRIVVDFEALDCLAEHSWPGNIRELDNVLKRAAITARGAPLSAEMLRYVIDAGSPEARAGSPSAQNASEEPIGPDTTLGSFLDRALPESRERLTEALERLFIERELQRQAGNVSRAAERLGMHRATLHRKLEELGIQHRPR